MITTKILLRTLPLSPRIIQDSKKSLLTANIKFLKSDLGHVPKPNIPGTLQKNV